MNASGGGWRRVLSLSARREQWPEGRRPRVSAALVLAFAALCACAPVAAGASSDAQATHAYLLAQYKLVRASLHDAPAVHHAESAAAAQIARECRGVLSGMPQPSLGVFPTPTPRAKGERARLTNQQQTIEVELTLDLPRYRCVKTREQPEIPASVVDLATGNTPEGEFFTISAFGSINGEPFVTVDTGVNPEVNEITLGRKASKAFSWSLSIGCAPHPYAILYGILAPPGDSVTAQTAQGAVALSVVPIESRLHTKGQLVYGVFSALPSELTVLAANGSTVYTENLQAKAAEAAEFCEGYEEAPL